MKTTIAAGLLAASLAATPSIAADFTGARVEGRLGWDRINAEADYVDDVDAFTGSDHEDGVTFGAEAGYDARMGGNFVLGAYAGIDFATTDYCSEIFGNDEGCVSAGRNITVGVRAGAMVSSNALIYAKGGYSNGSIEVSYEDFDDVLDDFSIDEDRDGFHLGAGAELALSPNLYGKVEYVYTGYDGAEFSDPDFSAGIDASRHQVMLGFGLRI